METIIELLTTAGRFLVGFWPAMFIVVLVGVFKHKNGFGACLRASIKALAFTWVFIAIIRAVFFFLEMDIFPLISEPNNSRYFLVVGLLLLPLIFAIMLEERRKRLNIKTIQDMQALSPRQFEELVADTYRDQGHHVDVIGARGDHGIDLVVRTVRGETWLIQCKKYRGKVGEPVVRDFYGALRASEASLGAIVTTGQITDQARLWAEGKPLHLYDGSEFLKILQSTRYRITLPTEAKSRLKPSLAPQPVFKAAMQPAAEAIYATQASTLAFSADEDDDDDGTLPDKSPFMNLNETPDCLVCGIPMVERSVKRFIFKPKRMYICANAPVCKETRSVD